MEKKKRRISDEGKPGGGKSYHKRIRQRYSMVPRGLKLSKVHSFKQTYHPTAANFTTDANCTYTFSGTGAGGSGTLIGPASGSVSPAGYWCLRFTIADLPQWTSFSALFDTYRINKVVVKLKPYITAYTQLGNGAANLAAQPQWLSTVIDYDDQTLPTTESELLQYETFKETAPSDEHVRVLTPKVSMSAFKTSGTTIGYVQRDKQWIDAAYGDVEHYGMKGLVNGPAVLASQIQGSWKVYVTAYVSFKQTR